MALPIIQSAFTAGEVSPSLYGRTDLAKYHIGASTFRNGFVSYRGGFYSRAGTKFVGFSKQTGRAYPPRMIPFQFNINQGIALEFGHLYMRVVVNGAFVTESPFAITGATKASPCVITYQSLSTGMSATSNNAVVTSSYAKGDLISLAGGTAVVPSILQVVTTALVGLTLNAAGVGNYAPGDNITLSGGTATPPPVLTVLTTKVVSATIAAGGTGGTPGTQTVTGTTGTGTPFQASVTVSGGGIITAILSISVAGSYTANPTLPTSEPVTGASLVGAALNVVLGVATFAISVGGSFTANGTGNFTQASTTGTGSAATFKLGLFAPHDLIFQTAGEYTAVPANPVVQNITSGSGAGATYTVVWATPGALANDDWVVIEDVVGMTDLNGETFKIEQLTATTFALFDVYGNAVDSSAYGAYVSGGSASRIYTLATPYQEQDLDYIKYTESADVLSLCCVNQQTNAEYPPQDLTRTADDNWTLASVSFAASIRPPPAASLAASAAGSTDYAYVVTSVNPNDGTESIASPIAATTAAVDITSTAGSITVSWTPVPTVTKYNVYKATPGTSQVPSVGALFGFAGEAYGPSFIDKNIIADFTQVPPQHLNPFAQEQIVSVTPKLGGTGYTTATAAISSLTGSGAVITPIIVGTAVVAYLVEDGGANYLSTDTVVITGNGTGASASITVGPSSGTFPGVVGYFQQRRVYAYSLNNPDTYNMSQPGAFTNFDARDPPIDSDAIVGSPWATQVNGIQFIIQTAGGLLVFTGLSNWLLVGAGSFATNVQPISPASQLANPQPENGCSSTVPPIKINFDVIYLSSKDSFYFDQPYQLYALSEPIDLTNYSAQLFIGYTIKQHAWCQQPNKLLWSVRSDGIMLSLTFLKQQEVAGWARHDTNGLFKSVCSVTEPPVDALYMATQRFPGDNTAYMIERMDDRIWKQVEDTWCVDCGLSLTQPEPDATLRASSATGLGACSGVTGLVGGTNYSAGTTATVVDDDGEGPGTGAVVALTIVAGVITAMAFTSQGTGYISPALVISDPAGSAGGSGASATITLNNSATFTADAAVFAVGDIGKVIRMGGGIATVTAYTDTTHVTANITQPIVQTIPNSGGTPVPQESGSWTMTTPVTTITGLKYLAGATITGIADGQVVPATVVPANGKITLSAAASSVTLGLAFLPQLQSLYLDSGETTMQGQRKKIAAVTARVEASGAFEIGTNQPDGAALSPIEVAPEWNGMVAGPTHAVPVYGSAVTPLFTGDVRIPVGGGFDTRGQAAIQQPNPLPLQVLAFINEELPGDTPSIKVPDKQNSGKRAA